MKFKAAIDFRKSLEARLQMMAAETGRDLQSLRRKIAFDRLLARIFSASETHFFLKGGYAMELRFTQARVTKDVDLTFTQYVAPYQALMSELIWEELHVLGSIELHDFFTYQIGRAQVDLVHAPYGGSRYPISALIGGKLFIRFQLDVGADVLVDRIENIWGIDWLEFCGILPPHISMISIEQQFAEKLYAYTMPRGEKVNSRVKDLIDMVLLLSIKEVENKSFLNVLQKLFKSRHGHPLPEKLAPPPQEWEGAYVEMAKKCGITQDMQIGFIKLSLFYDSLKQIASF